MNEENENQKVEVGDIEKKISELEAKSQEYLEGWKKVKAEFINYKKDEEKHAANILKLVKIILLKKFLPILDSLEEAKKQKSVEVEAISSQIMQVLKDEGLEEIVAIGEKFDPQFHESIGTVEKDGEENLVAEELRKGYVVEGILLRPSLVKISIKKNN